MTDALFAGVATLSLSSKIHEVSAQASSDLNLHAVQATNGITLPASLLPVLASEHTKVVLHRLADESQVATLTALRLKRLDVHSYAHTTLFDTDTADFLDLRIYDRQHHISETVWLSAAEEGQGLVVASSQIEIGILQKGMRKSPHAQPT